MSGMHSRPLSLCGLSSEVGLLGYITGSSGSKLDAESEKFSATLGQGIFFHLFGRRMKEWREGREERRADKGGGTHYRLSNE